MATVTPISQVRFSVGEIIQHRLFGYRGVIADVDSSFQGSDAWYQSMAKSRPPKDKPWYHVLVDGAQHTTYVAERNLEHDPMPGEIDHPLVEELFSGFEDGRYIRSGHNN